MRKKVSSRPVKARRRWVINPKTRIVKSKRIYKRSRMKEGWRRVEKGEEG